MWKSGGGRGVMLKELEMSEVMVVGVLDFLFLFITLGVVWSSPIPLGGGVLHLNGLGVELADEEDVLSSSTISSVGLRWASLELVLLSLGMVGGLLAANLLLVLVWLASLGTFLGLGFSLPLVFAAFKAIAVCCPSKCSLRF